MPEIRIDIGGDASQFVSQATAALNAETKLETVVNKTKRAINGKSKADDQAARSSDKHGKAADRLNTNLSKTDKLLAGGISNVKNYLSGFMSLAAIAKSMAMVRAEMEALRQAENKLVQGSKTLDQATSDYANQNQLFGTQKGRDASRKQIMELKRKASIVTYGLTGNVISAAHSSFGDSGKVLSPDQLGIATAAGRFAQVKGLDGDALESVYKLALASGVKNQKDMEGFIQKLSAVQQKSQIKKINPFLAGALKGVLPAIQGKKGASFDYAIARYASSVDTQPSGDLAAEKIKQSTSFMGKEKVVVAMAERSGMAADKFVELPFKAREKAFSALITEQMRTGKGKQELAKMGLDTEQQIVLESLYNDEQNARRAFFEGLSSSQTGMQFRKDFGGYGKTIQGQRDKWQARTSSLQAGATPEMKLGKDIYDTAGAMLDDKTAREGGDWFHSDITEKRFFTAKILKNQIDQLKKGGVPQAEIDQLETDVRRNVLEYQHDYRGFIDPTAAAIGGVQQDINRLAEDHRVQIIHNYGQKQGDHDNPNTNNSPMGDG